MGESVFMKWTNMRQSRFHDFLHKKISCSTMAALVYTANIYIAKLLKYENTQASRNNVVALRIGNRNTD